MLDADISLASLQKNAGLIMKKNAAFTACRSRDFSVFPISNSC